MSTEFSWTSGVKVISGALLSVWYACIYMLITKQSPILRNEPTKLLSDILFQELKSLNTTGSKALTLWFRSLTPHCPYWNLQLDTFNKSTVLTDNSCNQQCMLFAKWPWPKCPFSSLCKSKPKFLWSLDQYKVTKLIKANISATDMMSASCVMLRVIKWFVTKEARGKYGLTIMFIHSVCFSFHILTVQDVLIEDFKATEGGMCSSFPQ